VSWLPTARLRRVIYPDRPTTGCTSPGCWPDELFPRQRES